MLTIQSSLTGQILLHLELEDGILSLSPEQIRLLLGEVGRSKIGGHVIVRTAVGSSPTPPSCFLGGAAIDNSRVWNAEVYEKGSASSDFAPL